MISRYRIVRGRRPVDDPLPQGIRQDARKHTRHPLRPTPEMVAAYLADPSDEAFDAFRTAYREEIARRRAEDPEPFDALARLATSDDVFLGCNCPTGRNPDVRRCHTWLALELLAEWHPELTVRFPTPR